MKTTFLGLAMTVWAAGQTNQVKLPPYAREVLPNGAVLCLLPKHDAPLLDLRAVIRGGAESDPAGLAGLSSVVAELLRHGTSTRTADQFAEELDQIGASFGTYVNAQRTAVSAEVLPEYAGRMIDLLADAVLRPTFPEPEVQKVLAQSIEASRSWKDSLRTAAWQYFRPFYFGPRHPYGRPLWGDELTLRRMARPLIADHHERMYVGANLTLIAVGNFETPEMRARLAQAFGQMPAGQAYQWVADSPVDRPKGPRLLLVDKPEATQTHFLIGFPGIHRTHPNRIAVWLVNNIFGGRFTSLLNQELRVNAGLTYGAYSSLNLNRLTGAIVISSFTATGTTAQAIDLALNVLKRFGRNRISAKQLASAKAYTKGSYAPENLQTAEQLAALLANLELFGLDREVIDDLYSRIDAVTLDQANAAVKKYFRADDLNFVLVGNASRIREAVRKYAPQMMEISIAEPGFELKDAKWQRTRPGRQR
jgi:predicted Zn-dependent peptidase